MEFSCRNDRAGRLMGAEKVRVDFIDRVPVPHVRNVYAAHHRVFGAEASVIAVVVGAVVSAWFIYRIYNR